jgi:hypothetical protein
VIRADSWLVRGTSLGRRVVPCKLFTVGITLETARRQLDPNLWGNREIVTVIQPYKYSKPPVDLYVVVAVTSD